MECWHFSDVETDIDAPSSTLTDSSERGEELLRMVDDVTTTRAKLLHFLAVARMPKAALAQKYGAEASARFERWSWGLLHCTPAWSNL